MKTILAILLLVASQVSLAMEVERTVDTTDSPLIQMNILSGDIQVIAWDKDQVKISGDYTGDPDTLEISTSESEVSIRAKSEERSWWGSNSKSYAKFEVYVPEMSKLRLEGTSTGFDSTGTKGRVSISSISGSIEVSGGRDRIQLNSVSGDIEASNCEGKVYLKTVSGEITADCDAKYFEGHSVSGDIEAKTGNSEDVKLVSVSGDINTRVVLDSDGRLDASTVSGDIDLLFGKPVDASFEINTGPGGNIKNRLTDDETPRGRHFGEELEFSVGKGGASVDLGTMSGTITVDED